MEALRTTAAHAHRATTNTREPSPLRPSRIAVLAMIAYLPLAFLATLAAGDLGDIGFWFVWTPVVAILLYLPVAGVVWVVDRRRRT